VIKSDRVVDIDLGDGTTKRSVTAGTHRAAMVLRALGIEKIEPPPRHAQVKPDQVRSQTWRMAQTTRNARLADLSSSDPIRWRYLILLAILPGATMPTLAQTLIPTIGQASASTKDEASIPDSRT
jgi:hypothetical protein